MNVKEELRGQLGDAPGFGEMQGIFAEAYQRSLGRTGDQVLKGQKAIEELNKAMEKGNVISAKVLPYVAEIAKASAEPGLAEARLKSFAEENRFRNQMSAGWKAFRGGGGEAGLAYFWRMAQEMGTWWEDNGATLGKYFEVFMVHLNTLRVGVGEFIRFAVNGEDNDLTKLAQDWGVNLHFFREQIISIYQEIIKIFTENSTQGFSEVLKIKVTNFTNSLGSILKSIRSMLEGLNVFFEGVNAFRALPWWQKVTPLALPSQLKMAKGLGKAVVGGVAATAEAGGAVVDFATKSSLNELSTDYRKYGVGGGKYGGTTTAPIINNLPAITPQMYSPALQHQLPPQQLNGNVNINVKVEGNSDLAKQLVTPEVQSIMRKQVQSGIAEVLNKAMPETPKP